MINYKSAEHCLKQLESVRHLPTEQLAYVLATIYHETAGTFKPIREYGLGKGKAYGTRYYGRGLVQITWAGNYDKVGRIIGVNLLDNPDLALKWDVAARIAMDGMVEGWFTGHKLGHHINRDKTDYIQARKIINGKDKAEEIAGYANQFRQYLQDKANSHN